MIFGTGRWSFLLSRSNAIATPHHLVAVPRTALALIAAGTLLTGFVVLAQSLVFFIGGREGIGSQLAEAFLAFSHYPSAIFHGVVVRALIFGIMPAGLISALPLSVVDGIHPWLLFVSAAVGIWEVLLARLVFYAGVRRYTSGNLITVRS